MEWLKTILNINHTLYIQYTSYTKCNKHASVVSVVSSRASCKSSRCRHLFSFCSLDIPLLLFFIVFRFNITFMFIIFFVKSSILCFSPFSFQHYFYIFSYFFTFFSFFLLLSVFIQSYYPPFSAFSPTLGVQFFFFHLFFLRFTEKNLFSNSVQYFTNRCNIGCLPDVMGWRIFWDIFIKSSILFSFEFLKHITAKEQLVFVWVYQQNKIVYFYKPEINFS